MDKGKDKIVVDTPEEKANNAQPVSGKVVLRGGDPGLAWLELVLPHLRVPDISRAELVCKRWRRLILSDFVWQDVFRRLVQFQNNSVTIESLLKSPSFTPATLPPLVSDPLSRPLPTISISTPSLSSSSSSSSSSTTVPRLPRVSTNWKEEAKFFKILSAQKQKQKIVFIDPANKNVPKMLNAYFASFGAQKIPELEETRFETTVKPTLDLPEPESVPSESVSGISSSSVAAPIEPKIPKAENCSIFAAMIANVYYAAVPHVNLSGKALEAVALWHPKKFQRRLGCGNLWVVNAGDTAVSPSDARVRNNLISGAEAVILCFDMNSKDEFEAIKTKITNEIRSNSFYPTPKILVVGFRTVADPVISTSEARAIAKPFYGRYAECRTPEVAGSEAEYIDDVYRLMSRVFQLSQQPPKYRYSNQNQNSPKGFWATLFHQFERTEIADNDNEKFKIQHYGFGLVANRVLYHSDVQQFTGVPFEWRYLVPCYTPPYNSKSTSTSA